MIIESYQAVPGLTQADYVSLMLASYIARNQVRAAISLGDIGTPKARLELSRAFAQATTRGNRSDVVRAISRALARATYPKYTGTLGATEVDFGDTVRIHAGTITWDGNESVELHGSPFGNEVFLNRFNTPGTDDSLEFVAVGELGSYALSVTRQGPADVTQVDTTLRIRSMRYEVHTTSTADVITEAELPQTRYLVLGAGPGSDTIDYLRVEPNTAVNLTATARWPGLAKVHLAWQSCAGGGGGGFPGGPTVAGNIVVAIGTSLGGAEVQVVGTGLTATTTSTGAFSIGGIPPSARPDGLVTLQVRRIGYHSGEFKVPAGTVGHTLAVHPASATPATAMSMTSTVEPIAAGGCRLLQVWTPPGRHQIVQLKVDTAPPGASVVVSPQATLLAVGQQVQLAATVTSNGSMAVGWTSANSTVAAVSQTGLVTAVASGSTMITAALTADTSKKDSALVRVHPPAGAAWIITAPAAEDTVNRDGPPGQPAVAVAAHAIGPTGTFQNPFAIVEFWARSTGAGVWRRIGQGSAATATLTDNGVNRFWTYSTPWDPDSTTAPFATPSLTRLDLIAIGVNLAGTVSATPLNALLWVRIP